MQVFLIRHPRPTLATGICYGQMDVDCEDPQPIADRLRPRIPADTLVFASPLRRARLLAQAIDPATRIDERLCEINFGEWEGRRWDDIDRAGLDAWAADVLNYMPPGGESVAQLQVRAIDFADFVESLNLPRVAIVAHAGILRALTGHWQQLPTETWTRLPFDFGSLTELSLQPGSPHETTASLS